MTHLLQLMYLTTNTSFKTYEKRAFHEYFMSCIMEALTNDLVTEVPQTLKLTFVCQLLSRVMQK